VDRSSAPRRRPSRTPAERIEAIRALRKLRLTAAEIAELLEMALSTVSRWLKRIGLGKRSRLSPPEPPNRYERARPGELVHLDVKKLGRFRSAGHRALGRGRPGRVTQNTDKGSGRGVVGWDFIHVCVDDATRLAYVEVLPDERGATAAGFLRRAVAWLAERGITTERVMSDNGSCYVSRDHVRACRELGLRHLRTRPYRPRTNGKAERFIQTLQNEWAYGRIYASSSERAEHLAAWLDHYNSRRPHGSLGHRPPAARLNELRTT
jgi:transposase InsO family protein